MYYNVIKKMQFAAPDLNVNQSYHQNEVMGSAKRIKISLKFIITATRFVDKSDLNPLIPRVNLICFILA
jgi:hypothetical protein